MKPREPAKSIACPHCGKAAQILSMEMTTVDGEERPTGKGIIGCAHGCAWQQVATFGGQWVAR